jgi:hypothetical protein
MNNIRKDSRGSHTSNMSPPLFINQSHPLPINSSASSIIPKLASSNLLRVAVYVGVTLRCLLFSQRGVSRMERRWLLLQISLQGSAVQDSLQHGAIAGSL